VDEPAAAYVAPSPTDSPHDAAEPSAQPEPSPGLIFGKPRTAPARPRSDGLRVVRAPSRADRQRNDSPRDHAGRASTTARYPRGRREGSEEAPEDSRLRESRRASHLRRAVPRLRPPGHTRASKDSVVMSVPPASDPRPCHLSLLRRLVLAGSRGIFAMPQTRRARHRPRRNVRPGTRRRR